MNVAHSSAEFPSATSLVEGFIYLLKDGFENPYKQTGTVAVIVKEYPELSFLAVFGDVLKIIQPVDDRPTNSKMVIPFTTLVLAFRDLEYLDWRDPAILETLDIEGNLNLAFHLGMSCVRPSAQTTENFNKMRALHKRKGHRNLTDVARLHRPTQHQLLELMENGTPAIITGLEPSPPCEDWTVDRLVEKYGDATACVRSSGQHLSLRGLAEQMKEFEDNPELENDPNRDKAYTEGAIMPQEMLDDFGPMFFDRDDFVPAQLWLGSVSTNRAATGLHCDPTAGFLFQVIGRKRIELYSADQADNLYLKKANSYCQSCWFNPTHPNYDAFPLAKEANAISVILHPGELLLQPAGWFHQVYALESPTMSVSYFWRY